jgi:hypothetical protein
MKLSEMKTDVELLAEDLRRDPFFLETIANSDPGVFAELLAEKGITSDQVADAALALLDVATVLRMNQAGSGLPVGPVASNDYDRRWQLHLHAASVEDMSFWIEPVEGGFQAVEVESGCSGNVASTAREAMKNYWNSVHHAE